MEVETQVCKKCQVEKSLSEYYTRSGKPHLHFKICKACFREIGKSQTPSIFNRRNALVESEKEVIDLLSKHGIPALPGKALGHQYADIIAWGCVLIEVKHSKLRPADCFLFSFTPQQCKYGIRGDVVVLICDYVNEKTYHVFSADDPIFYFRSGALKPNTCFMPNAKQRKNRVNRVTLLPEYMKEHQNQWSLVETIRLQVKEQLISQSTTLAKQLRYLDEPDPRVIAQRHKRKFGNAVQSDMGTQPT